MSVSSGASLIPQSLPAAQNARQDATGTGECVSVALYAKDGKYGSTSKKPHLYASVKLNKDLGRRCNVYADFHDLAGHPKAPFLTTEDAYHNRALTLGMTYKF